MFFNFLITFINTFKVYKNIYRSFISIYNILANLPALKIIEKNTLILILNFYKSNFNEIIKTLKPDLIIFDKSVLI